MISITSKSGSSEGVIFEELPGSKFKDLIPRVTKTKTLDGGVVYDHRGMVTADRQFNILAKALTKDQVEALQTIIENETYVNMACGEGFFEGVISRADIDNGNLNMDFWIYIPPAVSDADIKRMYEHDDLTITESITASVA